MLGVTRPYEFTFVTAHFMILRADQVFSVKISLFNQDALYVTKYTVVFEDSG